MSRHWSEEERWKGQWSCGRYTALIDSIDRGPCCKTTNDLYMQQQRGDHYIRTLQVTVAITTVKQEAVSQSLLPPASDRIIYSE